MEQPSSRDSSALQQQWQRQTEALANDTPRQNPDGSRATGRDKVNRRPGNDVDSTQIRDSKIVRLKVPQYTIGDSEHLRRAPIDDSASGCKGEQPHRARQTVEGSKISSQQASQQRVNRPEQATRFKVPPVPRPGNQANKHPLGAPDTTSWASSKTASISTRATDPGRPGRLTLPTPPVSEISHTRKRKLHHNVSEDSADDSHHEVSEAGPDDSEFEPSSDEEEPPRNRIRELVATQTMAPSDQGALDAESSTDSDAPLMIRVRKRALEKNNTKASGTADPGSSSSDDTPLIHRTQNRVAKKIKAKTGSGTSNSASTAPRFGFKPKKRYVLSSQTPSHLLT